MGSLRPLMEALRACVATLHTPMLYQPKNQYNNMFKSCDINMTNNRPYSRQWSKEGGSIVLIVAIRRVNRPNSI